jgi:hypothetical protein
MWWIRNSAHDWHEKRAMLVNLVLYTNVRIFVEPGFPLITLPTTKTL